VEIRRLLDWIITCVGLAVCILTAFYWSGQIWLIALSGGIAIVFFMICCIQREEAPETNGHIGAPARAGVKQIIHLGEDGGELSRWDFFGRTSLVIGRDSGENQVDINLADATYSRFIEVEHAVLNYADGSWYIEDLHSENGIRVQKDGDDHKYKLAPSKPCKIDPGDIIYIAETRLLVR